MFRKGVLLATGFATAFHIALAAVLLTGPEPAQADLGDCGQPVTDAVIPRSSDALFILRTSVNLEVCPLHICDVDSNGGIFASDALRVLRVAVSGDTSSLFCPTPPSTSSTTTSFPDTTSSTTSFTTTSFTTITSTTTLFTTTTTLPPNNPPDVVAPGVYRTFTEFPISLSIEASDPDGGEVSFSSPQLPDGCTVDGSLGRIDWNPSSEQYGAYALGLTVTDDGVPPASTEIDVPVRVLPPDACVIAECQPETGCTSTPVPIGQDCCLAEPSIRVGEPDATCPGGRVLYAGRNRVGFGRIQNCDLMEMIPFAQGGSTIRFHIEARCVSHAQPASLHVTLRTDDTLLVDSTGNINLTPRDDGFAQRLAMFFALSGNKTISELEGEEAELFLRLTDGDGVVVEQTIRIVLTRQDLADLPNPDSEDIPAGEAGCVGCHRPADSQGVRRGIEEAHPGAVLTCTECHGGNAAATTRADAHVDSGESPSFLKNLTSDQLDAVDLDYIRFVNPGDLRVADQTCGLSGCHPEHVANAPLSVMATYAAHYTLPRFLAGAQGRESEVAAVDVIDPDFNAETAPDGALPALTALRGPDPGADRSEIGTLLDDYLPKSCPTCHMQDFGRNQAAGTYRSSGCTACHMVYADDGLSRSEDPRLPKFFPPHPMKHELTTAIPTEQCAHCHFQGGRIGLHYRGIREGGFAPDKTPPNAQSLGKPLYGHDSDFYFSDEDTTNNRDETPPDLHFEAGMECVDCHIGGDVHGDGNLYGAERYQVGVECEDCHGSVRERIEPDPADGLFKNSKGFAMRRLRRDNGGIVRLELAMTGEELAVPQIKELLDAGLNPFMNDAMGVNEEGYSHADDLECYTCHTSWRQNCFGCHVTLDDTGSATNRTTGEVTVGSISAVRDNYTTDFFAIGMNRRGKISPLCSSMSMLFSYKDETGTEHYADQIRRTTEGRQGFGWNPFHHHTVSRIPVNCDRCHPSTESDNSALLAATYGFGMGTGPGGITATDGDGETYDLTRFLSDEGELISEFPHPGTGPVPAHLRESAMAITVTPHPR